MDVDPLQVAGAITVVGGAGAVLYGGARWANARWRRVAEFLDDWNGEPARPGFPGRPGMPERLSTVEVTAAAIRAEVSTIRAEVTPNGGGSMKDAVGRIDRRTRENGELLRRHLDWHTNRGEVDPTARVILTRPEDTN